MVVVIKSISIPYDWENIDSKNSHVDVFIKTTDDYTYIISVATTKNIESLMDEDKTNYYGPTYPVLIVKEITQEVIEETMKAYAAYNGGYWLKMYHFAGDSAYIDDSLFDQLKAKDIKKKKEFDSEFDESPIED